MSGICGILRLDGGPPEGIEAMAHHLRRRGPQGTRFWRGGSCALAHCLLIATPEAATEIQPLTHAGTGCTITADLRLDNREDLLAALAPGRRDTGDAELALLAYLRWGDDCPLHLEGDFAFAIHDPRNAAIFAARDRMGLKQLIWSHVGGKVFAFASEPQAVLRAEGIPARLNEGRIADALEPWLEGIDRTSTFFEGVFRLPPAHILRIDAKGLRTARYWAPVPGPELRLSSDDEYAEAFREVLSRAVRRRLRAPEGRVGSMLSGGMDSGAVVALAARLFAQEGRGPFPTFSGVGPDPAECIETRTIHEALTMANLSPSLVDWSDPGPLLERMQAALFEVEEPFDAHMNILRALALMAQDRGMSVLLGGTSGDVVLTPGPWMGRLLRQGRLTTLWREAQGNARFWSMSPWYFLEQAARQGLVPFWLRRLWFRRKLRRARTGPMAFRMLSPAAAERVGIRARALRDLEQDRPERLDFATHRARSIVHASLTVGLERYDRVLGRFGLEFRDPYTDPEVIAFSLSLPGAQLQRDGWLKYVQRTAMAGLLPDSVRWRPGKEHLGWRFTDHLYRSMEDEFRRRETDQFRDFVARFVNPDALDSGQAEDDSVNNRGEVHVNSAFALNWGGTGVN